jgi:hypothetical protein
MSALRPFRNWFFEKYIPTWVAAGGDSHGDPRKVLDYWGVPMHATVLVTPPNQTRWLSTKEQVLGLLCAIQTPLTEFHAHQRARSPHDLLL